MPPSRAQVVEYLSALSPERLQDLILELEDRWGIERVAAVGERWITVMGVALPIDGHDERTEWDVVLLDVGPDRIGVMKALREGLELPLREAKAIVDGAPVLVGEALSHGEAEALIGRLSGAGATAERR